MRCNKCNGCISSFDEYRPEWCDNSKCPQGAEMPESIKLQKKMQLDLIFGKPFSTIFK